MKSGTTCGIQNRLISLADTVILHLCIIGVLAGWLPVRFTHFLLMVDCQQIRTRWLSLSLSLSQYL